MCFKFTATRKLNLQCDNMYFPRSRIFIFKPSWAQSEILYFTVRKIVLNSQQENTSSARSMIFFKHSTWESTLPCLHFQSSFPADLSKPNELWDTCSFKPTNKIYLMLSFVPCLMQTFTFLVWVSRFCWSPDVSRKEEKCYSYEFRRLRCYFGENLKKLQSLKELYLIANGKPKRKIKRNNKCWNFTEFISTCRTHLRAQEKT